LPAGSVSRQLVVGDALRIARRAAAGLVAHLRRLGRAGVPVPRRLLSALDQLVDGYGQLAASVSGPDRDLAAVPALWRSMRDRDQPGDGAVSVPRRRKGRRDRRRGAGVSSLIDPRQIPARLLALSADPAAGEVHLMPTADGDEVRIEVPAFGAGLDEDTTRRLQVRLIDRHTSDPLRYGLLTIAATRSAGRRFQCIVPSRGLDLQNLRADVYDTRSSVPPAPADSDTGLCEARRATVFLGEWRRLVAAAELCAVGGGMTSGVRALAERVERAAGGRAVAAFRGGPTADALSGMIGHDDTATAGRLRAASAEPGAAAGALGSTSGPGHLLVAELWSAREDLD